MVGKIYLFVALLFAFPLDAGPHPMPVHGISMFYVCIILLTHPRLFRSIRVMAHIRANGVQIEYETFGKPTDRPLLLIIGMGGQLIWWDEALCSDLAERGHYVIRFDNRDAGLSAKFGEAGRPDLPEVYAKFLTGERIQPPYGLEEMADDATGLLDALGIERAHLCGMSMGGMIAQTMAIRHSPRLLSLISIFSSTGNPELPKPTPEAMNVFVAPVPSKRDEYIEHQLHVRKTLAGRGFPVDEPWVRAIMARCYDRCFYPEGTDRQLLAVLTQADRRSRLRSLRAPALVIHGTDDPLIPMEGGKDTARSIPGSELMLIEGMGHDIPHGGAWPRIVGAVAAHTARATRTGNASATS